VLSCLRYTTTTLGGVLELMHKPKLHRLSTGCISVVLCLLTACTTAAQPASHPPNADVGTLVAVPIASTPEPTGIPTQGPGTPTSVSTVTARPTTAVEAARAAKATADAQYLADIRTKYAPYTAVPIPTLGPPQPSPTWVMGMQGCVNGISYAPLMLGCWRGVLNGEFLSIAGGRQTEGDRRQGLLLVFHGPLFDPLAATTEVYSTPMKLGAVRLVSVEGTRCTLIPFDPIGSQGTPTPLISPTPSILFVFDLATRQWGSPGPTPVPSLPPSPGP
jgi:hypothetical protein